MARKRTTTSCSDLKRETVDSPPAAFASGATPRSETQKEMEAKGESTVRSVGLDWGSRISFCEVSGRQVIQRATVRGLQELERFLGPGTPKARVAIECCREGWYVVDRLRQWGHQPELVDTTRVKQLGIGHHRRKNDRIDAEVLARAVEEDRIPRAHELSAQRQELRMALNARALLVGLRSSLYVAIKGHLRTRGVQLPKKTPQDFVAMVRKTEDRQPPALKELLEPLLQSLSVLEEQISKAEDLVDRLSRQESAIEVLKTRPGVGAVVASAFVAVVDDPRRFDNAHQVESYIGLVPSEDTSGKRRLGSITKKGNAYLRAVLIQAAWSTLRARGDDPLTIWGKAIVARRGRHIAAVAVARRLAGILWAMWRDDRVYDARLLGQASADGLERESESKLVRAHALKKASRKVLPTHRAGRSKRVGTVSAASQL
jgi:transposase